MQHLFTSIVTKWMSIRFNARMVLR